MSEASENAKRWLDVAGRYETETIKQGPRKEEEQETQEHLMKKYHKRVEKRISQHVVDLQRFIWSEEFIAAKRLLAAVRRSVCLGSFNACTISISKSGFIIVTPSSKKEDGCTFASLDEVARGFYEYFEEPDYRGNYPGGILAWIREKLNNIAEEAPELTETFAT